MSRLLLSAALSMALAGPLAAQAPLAPPAPVPTPAPAPQFGAPPPAAAASPEAQDFGVPPTAELHSGAMHGPTPTQIPGGRVIATQELAALLTSGRPVLLLDVLGGQQMLPGAVTGIGAAPGGSFNDQIQQGFSQYLYGATRGQTNFPIVTYCASPQCWMSYNAALRAIRAGFTNVAWYRGGVEAWSAAGYPLMSAGAPPAPSRYAPPQPAPAPSPYPGAAAPQAAPAPYPPPTAPSPYGAQTPYGAPAPSPYSAPAPYPAPAPAYGAPVR